MWMAIMKPYYWNVFIMIWVFFCRVILRPFKKLDVFYPGEFYKVLHAVRISADLLLRINRYVWLIEQWRHPYPVPHSFDFEDTHPAECCMSFHLINLDFFKYVCRYLVHLLSQLEDRSLSPKDTSFVCYGILMTTCI